MNYVDYLEDKRYSMVVYVKLVNSILYKNKLKIVKPYDRMLLKFTKTEVEFYEKFPVETCNIDLRKVSAPKIREYENGENVKISDYWFNRYFDIANSHIGIVRNSFRFLFSRFVLTDLVIYKYGNDYFFNITLDDGEIISIVIEDPVNIDTILEALKEIHNITVSRGFKGSDMIYDKIEIKEVEL